MGRGKLNMKFIMKEKVRISTYEKRKKGLLKKAEEFSILCGVETCVIIYGPKSNESATKLEIWPPVHAEVMNVINKYKAKPLHVRERKCFNVLDFFAIHQKKLNDEICKLRKANREAKFTTWDDRINTFSVNQLSELLVRLESNLETAKNRIKMIKGNQQSFIEDSKPFILGGPETQVIQPTLNLYNQARSSLFQKNLDMEIIKQQQQRQQPMFTVPSYHPFSSSTEALQWQPFNLNTIENPMTMLPPNGTFDFTQIGGECSSNITQRSLSPPQAFNYDPAAVQMVDVLSNPWPGVPICFYGQIMPQMTPFVQPSMSSFPAQFDETYRNAGDRSRSLNKKQKF
ncbi:Detected protein of unknown function [Hibiscus syriacus]|uniref:MADS-box domain-containing protein n=1 Tax=Hibiscus syriacus TaxID=106335 RepID=A0A6A2WS78_HIBSY|nr:agamous-like MADS-box protein MADS1 [Hibiscus syriacus]KAE8663648.1 Detected protein of unknown function [Hibiscus syriacus]